MVAWMAVTEPDQRAPRRANRRTGVAGTPVMEVVLRSSGLDEVPLFRPLKPFRIRYEDAARTLLAPLASHWSQTRPRDFAPAPVRRLNHCPGRCRD
jgi:hypothetical protein